MSEIVVIAKLVPREGKLGELLELLSSLIPRVHREERGCMLYAAHRARGQENGPVFMIEKFASIEAFEEHGASPTMIEHQPKLAAALDGPIEVTLLDPVPFGDLAKGRLPGEPIEEQIQSH